MMNADTPIIEFEENGSLREIGRSYDFKVFLIQGNSRDCVVYTKGEADDIFLQRSSRDISERLRLEGYSGKVLINPTNSARPLGLLMSESLPARFIEQLKKAYQGGCELKPMPWIDRR